MSELHTVMCAREKCASARVQVGVVSTSPNLPFLPAVIGIPCHQSCNFPYQFVKIFPRFALSSHDPRDFCPPGIFLIHTLPDLVASSSHKRFSSTCPVFQSPLEAIAFAALEAVQTLTRDLTPKSSFNNCTLRPSAVPVMTVLYFASTVLNARVAYVPDQRLTTVPLCHHHASARPLPLGPFRPARIH